jgi:hypothetical protein
MFGSIEIQALTSIRWGLSLQLMDIRELRAKGCALQKGH